MPEQVTFTLCPDLASTEIHFNDPDLGTRLRAAYFRKRGVDPDNLPKRISPEVFARVIRRFRAIQIGDLMREMFSIRRLDGFKLRTN